MRTEVDLIEEENRATAHGVDHGSVLPDGLTVDQSESTEEVVLVRGAGNVDAETLTIEVRTRLHDHSGLAVTRQTSDVHRGEQARLDDRFDGIMMTPRHIGLETIGHEAGGTSGHPTNRGQFRHGGIVTLRSSRSSNPFGSSIDRSSSGGRVDDDTRIVEIRDGKPSTIDAEFVRLDEPRRSVLLPHAIGDGYEVATLRRAGETSGAARIDERLLLRGQFHYRNAPLRSGFRGSVPRHKYYTIFIVQGNPFIQYKAQISEILT